MKKKTEQTESKKSDLLNEVESFLIEIQTKLIGIKAVEFTELNFDNQIICDQKGIMGSIADSVVKEISQFTSDNLKKYRS